MEFGNNMVIIIGKMYPKCMNQATKRFFLTADQFDYDFLSFNRYRYRYENHILRVFVVFSFFILIGAFLVY
jgi:hypothetical protein